MHRLIRFRSAAWILQPRQGSRTMKRKRVDEQRRRRDEQKRALVLLHGDGWSCPAIARVLNVSAETVRQWLSIAGIAPNPSKFHAKFDAAEVARMYRAGASDGDVARRFGATQSGALRWRQRHGVEANYGPNPPLDPHVIRSARRMLADGASRRQVADAHDIACLGTVQKIRRRMDRRGIRPTGLTNRAIRSQVLRDKTVLPRITKAVGRHLPVDVKHDAVSALYLEVLDGRIRRDLIEERAPRFRAKAYALNGGDYSHRSLDDDSAGWSMLDRLEDPNALSWLEDMEQ